MQDTCYTAVTFSPVQGFIERSRKLRDLYGSSFILSYLAQAICQAAKAQGHRVISPALPDVARGTPNQIVIKGDFGHESAKHAFDEAWRSLVKTCQTWLEEHTSGPHYWKRDWNLWISYAWEFFWEQGSSISDARIRLNESKLCRDWTGINWTGESSTLSGTDAVAWPGLGYNRPDRRNAQAEKEQIAKFYGELRAEDKLGEAFVDETEELSIPELVKRMVTYKPIIRLIDSLTAEEVTRVQDVRSFADLNRKDTDRYTGWFRGDGDRIGLFLQKIGGNNEDVLNGFSQAMVNWAEKILKHSLPSVSDDPKHLDEAGRIIYAGGDDFLGVLYHAEEDPKLSAWKCLNWFLTFNDQVWMKHHEELIRLLPEAQRDPPLTVSVGWVWAAPGVPQRDVLQHCDEAERAAKDKGRDRIAIRILFNSGNYLEWACPWWFLPHIFEDADQTDWIGFYKDVATLENRHAFDPKDHSVALGLFEVYFSPETRRLLEEYRWDRCDGKSGILGNTKDQSQSLNSWVRELAKVGFHLCSDI